MKKSLTQKFGIYSALGLAGGMTFGTTASEADVIFTDFNGSVTLADMEGLEIDIDGNSTVDFVFDIQEQIGQNGYGSYSNWALIRAEGINRFMAIDPSPFDGGPGYGPNNLAAGAVVSAGQSFGTGSAPLQMAYLSYNSSNIYGAFGGANFPLNGNSGYIGVEFEGGGETFFGWINVTVDGDVREPNIDLASITVNGFAYESVAGQAITVGVPEPSSIGLLALGAAGLATRRRKNSNA